MTTLLDSTVTRDPVSGLYTYDYSVNNATDSTIWNIDILVLPSDGKTFSQPDPPPYTAPQQWIMYGSVGGPKPVFGGFYEFYSQDNAVQPGGSLSGFSFTTPFAPSSSPLDNYFLYGSLGIIGEGNVLAPSGALAAYTYSLEPPPRVSETPLPDSIWMMATGLLMFAVLLIRRRKYVTC